MNTNQYTIKDTYNDQYYKKAISDMETVLGGFALFVIFLMILCIWSMISMISLNARFKDFYKIYTESKDGGNLEKTDNTITSEIIDEKDDEKTIQNKPGSVVSKTVLIMLGIISIVAIGLAVFFAMS